MMMELDDGTLGNMVRRARAALAPLEHKLRAACERAWDLAQAEFGTYKRWPDSRVRSNIVQHRIVQEVEHAFKGRMFVAHGRSLLNASEGVVAHFKKLDENGRSRNYPTQLALSFSRQLSLPGIPPSVRVTVGYVTNRDHTVLHDMLASIVIGKSVLDVWVLKATPVVAIGQPAPTERKRARARKDAAKRGKAGTGSDDGNRGNG